MNCILVQMCVCAVLCTVLCFYIAERALYMYVHDLANPLLFADNVMFQHSRGFVFKNFALTFERCFALR